MFPFLSPTTATASSSSRSQTVPASRESSARENGPFAADHAAPDFSRTLDRQLRDATARREAERSPSRPAPDSPAGARSRPAGCARTAERAPEGDTPVSPPPGAAETDNTASTSGLEQQQEPGADTLTAPHSEATAAGAEAATIAALPAALAALVPDSAAAAEEGETALFAAQAPAADNPGAQTARASKPGARPAATTSAAAGEAAEAQPGQTPATLFAASLHRRSTSVSGAADALPAADHDHAGPAAARPAANPAPGAGHDLALPAALRHAPGSHSVPQLAVATAAQRQGWAEDVGNQVKWMIGRAESKAELVLTPPNLGKLEVSIVLTGDQTTAQFVASTQAARDALEQALPRLREMLNQAGIGLGQTDVSTAGDQSGASAGQQRGGSRSGTSATVAADEPAPQWISPQQGLVDTFV